MRPIPPRACRPRPGTPVFRSWSQAWLLTTLSGRDARRQAGGQAAHRAARGPGVGRTGSPRRGRELARGDGVSGASIEDATTRIEGWRQDHKENHPHRALEGLSPDECARRAIVEAADSPS